MSILCCPREVEEKPEFSTESSHKLSDESPSPIRLIIAGTHTFTHHDLFNARMTSWINHFGVPSVVLCGMAPGADTCGFVWAKRQGIKIEKHPADWGRYGLGAGPIRNRKMAERATHLIAFWDGRSRGTLDMITVATELGLEVEVARY